MKQVAIIAATFTGNRGAEAMLTTTIGRIRERFPKCWFNVFSYYPTDDRRIINDESIRIYSATPLYLVAIMLPASVLFSLFKWLPAGLGRHLFPASVRALNDSAVLIDLAGVSFIDGREKFLPYNILTLFPAMLLKVPVVKFAQALGPFNGFLNRLAGRLFLKKCDKIFARGKQTFGYLQTLPGISRKVVLTTDIAFLQKKGDSLSCEVSGPFGSLLKALHDAKSKGDKIIGVCPSAVLAQKCDSQKKDYRDIIAKICAALITAGYVVVLFPNATRGNTTKLRNNDLPVIKNIFDRLAESKFKSFVYKADFDMNADSIKELISLCNAVAVSRFHAMIASLSIGIPTLVMGWSHKYYEIMSEFNLEKYVFDHAVTKPADFLLAFEQLFSQKDDISARIMSEIPALQKLARKQIDYVNGILDQA